MTDDNLNFLLITSGLGWINFVYIYIKENTLDDFFNKNVIDNMKHVNNKFNILLLTLYIQVFGLYFIRHKKGGYKWSKLDFYYSNILQSIVETLFWFVVILKHEPWDFILLFASVIFMFRTCDLPSTYFRGNPIIRLLGFFILNQILIMTLAIQYAIGGLNESNAILIPIPLFFNTLVFLKKDMNKTTEMEFYKTYFFYRMYLLNSIVIY